MHTPFDAVCLHVSCRTIEDHDTLFVLAEVAHFVGIGLLGYKMYSKRSAAGEARVLVCWQEFLGTPRAARNCVVVAHKFDRGRGSLPMAASVMQAVRMAAG